jgi:hypothetical protein
MEVVGFSETFLIIYQTTQRHIPEDSDPQGTNTPLLGCGVLGPCWFTWGRTQQVREICKFSQNISSPPAFTTCKAHSYASVDHVRSLPVWNLNTHNHSKCEIRIRVLKHFVGFGVNENRKVGIYFTVSQNINCFMCRNQMRVLTTINSKPVYLYATLF